MILPPMQPIVAQAPQLISGARSAVKYAGPSLVLRFDADAYRVGPIGRQPAASTLAGLVTFTRASGGGRFNASGNYEYLGNDVPRLDYDPVTLQPLGLLIEEQRTNLLTYSSDLTNAAWVKTNVTTPDTETIKESAVTGEHHIQRNNVTTVSGQTYSFTFKTPRLPSSNSRLISLIVFLSTSPFTTYMSAAFDPYIGEIIGLPVGTATAKIVGDDWEVTVTGVVSATSVHVRLRLGQVGSFFNYAGDGTSSIKIKQLQLEAGAFPTSYIPTVASQVTRSADVASVNTLSPWYNASEGALFVEFATRNQLATFADAAVLDDGTANNRVRLGINSVSPNKLVTGSYSGGVQVAVNTDVPYTLGLQKLAASYAKDNFASAANGALYAVASIGNVPAGLSVLRIGKHTSSGYLNGHIRNISYYPRRLTDGQLQSLTTP